MDYNERYMSWVNDDYFDLETRGELEAIKGNEKEIEDRFFMDLDFGTAGLRGVIGAGTNRMNIYTVRKATQGLANYILKQGPEGKSKGVCIAYDSRHFSKEFAEVAALVLNGNGIKTYIFDSLRPTPELSFAVRHQGAIAGIVVTASHNPPEYNGYKVYWSDGAQVPYPRDGEIIAEVNNVTDFKSIKFLDKGESVAKGLFNVMGEEVDKLFISNVKAQTVNLSLIDEVKDDLIVVYTPLHGTGNIPVRRTLKELGYKNVYVVGAQELPDPDFSTVGYPNPEDPKAFKLAIELAKEKGADIVFATDPDCDRVGCAVKDKTGEYKLLSGNMTGILITNYILSEKQKNGVLPENGTIISTIVSSDMTKAIAKAYNVGYIDVLTGFKYIGEKIKEFEESGSNTYLFGFEESYGCLAGTYARDKDAVVASMLLCELAAYYKKRGMNLYDGMIELYEKYGYYVDQIQSVALKGIEGLSNIKKIMAGLRANQPKTINGIDIAEVRDYGKSEAYNLATGLTEKLDMPVSNVLYYVLADESWFCIRPSGTEPKIKIYYGVKGKDMAQAEEKAKQLKEGCMALVDSYLS
ncbi:MAG: phospho-sugar mutase [Clostridiales bacterium]|jgi:phosphoglucomutase|nr:phospho-sugar mutase [Clostridiales bacterium]